VNTSFAKAATSEAQQKKYRELAGFFKKYGDRYQLTGCSWRPGIPGVGARPEREERVGAVGVMQVMPATGQELKVGDIRQVEPTSTPG